MTGYRKHSGRKVDSGVVKLSGSMKSDTEYVTGDEVIVITRARVTDEKYSEDSHGSFVKTMFAKGQTLAVAPEGLQAELAQFMADIEAEQAPPEVDDDPDEGDA